MMRLSMRPTGEEGSEELEVWSKRVLVNAHSQKFKHILEHKYKFISILKY